MIDSDLKVLLNFRSRYDLSMKQSVLSKSGAGFARPYPYYCTVDTFNGSEEASVRDKVVTGVPYDVQTVVFLPDQPGVNAEHPIVQSVGFFDRLISNITYCGTLLKWLDDLLYID